MHAKERAQRGRGLQHLIASEGLCGGRSAAAPPAEGGLWPCLVRLCLKRARTIQSQATDGGLGDSLDGGDAAESPVKKGAKGIKGELATVRPAAGLPYEREAAEAAVF